jgi:hypothetical protein
VSIGDPVVRFHLEVETDECVCNRLRCGGVMVVNFSCPEHGSNSGPEGRFHTHAMQVDRISVGTLAL